MNEHEQDDAMFRDVHARLADLYHDVDQERLAAELRRVIDAYPDQGLIARARETCPGLEIVPSETDPGFGVLCRDPDRPGTHQILLGVILHSDVRKALPQG